jgi:hypothetical protein
VEATKEAQGQQGEGSMIARVYGYSHRPPCFAAFYPVKGGRPKPNSRAQATLARKKKTMKTKTKNQNQDLELLNRPTVAGEVSVLLVLQPPKLPECAAFPV